MTKAKKVSKPKPSLRIVVATAWLYSDWAELLRKKGHEVLGMGLSDTVDLILHTNAHMWNEDMLPMLDIAVKAAKERKYGK